MSSENTDLIRSLKYNAKTQYNKKIKTENELDQTVISLIKSWKLLLQNNIKVDDIVWSHFKSLPDESKPYYRGNSEFLGIKSVIKPYTNKKGITFDAHHTVNGKYIDSTKKLGDKPVYYDGYFKISKDKFMINEQAILKCEYLDPNNLLGFIFKPIEIVELEETDLVDSDEE